MYQVGQSRQQGQGEQAEAKRLVAGGVFGDEVGDEGLLLCAVRKIRSMSASCVRAPGGKKGEKGNESS